VTRWAIALGASLLVHSGAAVGTLGMMSRSPSFEVTVGEARVALAFRPRPSPPPSSLNLEPVPPKKWAESLTAIPEVEGAESSAAQSLRNPPPPYPAEAFRRGIQGVTSLLVHVNAQGAASQVTMERSSGSAILDEAAVGAVMKWTFIPARRAGGPVSGAIRIRIRFQIVEAAGRYG
jgi:TonB family protein